MSVLLQQAPLPDAIANGLGLSGTLGEIVASLIGAFLIANILLITAAIAGPWAKRKIMGAFVGKIGPNRIGPAGLLIIVADAVRFLSKEVIIPEGADRPAYEIAPLLLPFSAMLGFAVIPMGNGIHLADPESGAAFVFAAASIASLGLLMAGYASNNKYSLMGGLRSVAQNIAYEIPLIVTAASAILLAGSLQMSEIVAAQTGTLVQVGSALAYRGIPLQSAYCGAKHAIEGMFESVRSELIHNGSNVHMTMVQMPALNTPQFGWVRSKLDKKAQPVPPIYQPEVAADAIVYAAESRRRQVYVGYSSAQVIVGNKVVPQVGDWYLGKTGYDSQQRDEPEDPDRPDNLFEPVEGDFGAHGVFDEQAKSTSPQLWATKNRGWIAAAGAAVAGAVGTLVVGRARRS